VETGSVSRSDGNWQNNLHKKTTAIPGGGKMNLRQFIEK